MVAVINIRDAPPGWDNSPEYQYIGRAGHGFDGYFGNPFQLLNTTRRDEVIIEYRNWFYGRLYADEEFRERILGLINKTLVCFCKPKTCHGDVITEFLSSTQSTIWPWGINDLS